MSEEKLTSKQYLAELSAKHYQDAIEGKKRGELVAWSSSIAPQEFCETMGIHVIYPENHAAAIGAKGGALPMIDYAESKGYSADICSYARINLAYKDMQDCCFENVPLPDLLIICNNICNVLVKWYENLSKELNIPLICIDVPYNTEYEVTQERVDYINGQFQEAIRQLEEICGKPFDYERFQTVMENSTKAANAWNRAMKYTQYVPSPLNGFNIFNYMAMMVCNRGREESAKLYNMIADELEELVQNGKSQFPVEEKFRIMWEGIACWPYLSHNFKTFKQYGINMVGSTYPEAWTLLYEAGDLDSMARAYASVMNNNNLKSSIDLRVRVLKENKCDGAVYHLNRSCKLMDLMQYKMSEEVYKQTGIPYITFDGDQTDPRGFAKAQFETRIQALVEMMESNKAENK
ncbi:MAG: 2-hydroxyacyl-CoA dehydratase family protein [Syntrophomonas sp.]|nr:2-hydroxyacyl-CoA dehydratase family protein [Syntrophomonas sp.]